MREQQAVLQAEGDRPIEVLLGRAGAGRVVRIAQEHDLRPGQHVFGNVREIREEAVLLFHGHEVRVRVRERRAAGVHGIADGRRQHVVARIDERGVQMRDALFAPDERKHFACRVDLNAETVPQVRGARLAIGRRPGVIRVLVVRGLANGLGHRVHDVRRRGHVGIPDA